MQLFLLATSQIIVMHIYTVQVSLCSCLFGFYSLQCLKRLLLSSISSTEPPEPRIK